MAQYPAVIALSSLNGTTGFSLSGANGYEAAGIAVAGAGDVNGDGFADLLIGSDANTAYLVYGKATGFASNLDLSSLNGTSGFELNGPANSFAGQAVSSAGDVNGDGISDVIVGASGDNIQTGAAYVVFGKSGSFGASLDLTTLTGTDGFKLTGVATGDLAGTSVSQGDVNGDGFSDLIIGAPAADPHGSDSGAAYVVFGKASGFAANLNLSTLNGTNGFELSGVSIADRAGTSVGSVDVNGDGRADLIIGAPFTHASEGGYSGATYVVFGKTSGFAANLDLSTLNGTNGFRISGAAANEDSGISVASAADVNGDGFQDLIVGAYNADGHAGAAYVVFGKASGFSADLDLSTLDGTSGFKISGANSQNYAGFSVSSAGDVNGDGLADLLVGASFASPHAFHSGQSYLVFGRLPDTAVTRAGTAASQSLVGGNLGDVLTGGGGNDKLYGNGGNDLLTGGPGNDWFNGGLGTDTVSYQYATADVHVSLLTAAPQNTVGAGTDTLISIEKIIGSLYADTLTANTAGATLNGLSGGDDLISGPGNDILNGGGAADFADYSLAAAGVTVDLTNTGFQATVGAGHDQLVSIEKLVGSNFADVLTGDANPNTLFGEGGDDHIDGGSNDDILYGNAGNDSLTGGLGQDAMTGGAGNDTFIFAALAESTLAHPDTITDFTSGQDHIGLSAIDANTALAGDQAFHLGGGGGHAGDLIVHAFDAVHNRTEIDLYVDNNASIDAAIWLTGDHHALAAGDFVL